MSCPVFVCGATGTQGGFVARHLRKANVPVHALVRDPSSANSKALEAIGVTLFRGSWDDTVSLKPALRGTKAAFLNFMPSFTDPRQELRDAHVVLAAAKGAGVEHIVYSSLSSLEDIIPLVSDMDPNGLAPQFFRTKMDILDAVTSVDFATYTILRPSKFMSDFFGPSAIWYGNLTTTGVFETAQRKGATTPFVDPDDIGAFAAAALTDPEKFGGQKVDVHTEVLTLENAISMLGAATGKDLRVRFLQDEEIEEKAKVDVFTQVQMVMRDTAALVTMDSVTGWGVPVGSFRNFLEREKAALDETYASVPDSA